MMTISRRSAMAVLGGAISSASVRRLSAEQAQAFDIAKGPFQATRESLKAYRVPDWFRDAKFGIWAHWGPQSAAEYGDWYARRMYFQGERQYEYHVKTYGHPSKFGFKDVIATWKADKFDPDHLMQECRGEVLLQHGCPPRQLRLVELEVSAAVERGGVGTEEGHRGSVPAGGPQAGDEVRGERTPGLQL
jgi:hypothetical protein